MEQANDTSAFTRQIDRAALGMYFLGAVVPLAALAVVVQLYVLPSLPPGSVSTALVGAVVSIGVLSLGAFLILRRVTRRTIARIEHDNTQLTALLEAARTLSSTEHLTEGARTAAHCALELADAHGVFLFLCEASKPALASSAGESADALYGAMSSDVDEMAELVTEEGRSVLRAVERGAEHPFAAAAVPLPGEQGPLGALVAIQCGTNAHLGHRAETALSSLAALSAVALTNADLRDAQRNFFSHVTDMLVTALDSHLGFNIGHGTRVAALANQIGRAMELPDERLQRLHFAALLHDIGMLKLDRSQQMNPRTCERHSSLGFRMLHRIRLWKDVAPSVEAHHEWWDGSGYPQGLAGDDIPLEARIIALADAFDTMTSESSYKTAISTHEAVEEIRRCTGRQFDPNVAEHFERLWDEGGLP